jgi:hypothetical protein
LAREATRNAGMIARRPMLLGADGIAIRMG